jgi:hypothetical protein
MSAEVFQASGHLQSQLGGSSSPKEWNEYGSKFYEQKKYEPAMECFKNAGNQEMLHKCEAFLAEDTARKLELQDKAREARDAYMRAAGGGAVGAWGWGFGGSVKLGCQEVGVRNRVVLSGRLDG